MVSISALPALALGSRLGTRKNALPFSSCVSSLFIAATLTQLKNGKDIPGSRLAPPLTMRSLQTSLGLGNMFAEARPMRMSSTEMSTIFSGPPSANTSKMLVAFTLSSGKTKAPTISNHVPSGGPALVIAVSECHLTVSSGSMVEYLRLGHPSPVWEHRDMWLGYSGLGSSLTMAEKRYSVSDWRHFRWVSARRLMRGPWLRLVRRWTCRYLVPSCEPSKRTSSAPTLPVQWSSPLLPLVGSSKLVSTTARAQPSGGTGGVANVPAAACGTPVLVKDSTKDHVGHVSSRALMSI
mmetsp:Transcript_51215/g.153863  ORF Transcript_51215/g.153863 Transcript_51215/m.153863 type:complete len:294 (-) Transcript_51215:771-1652(-)